MLEKKNTYEKDRLKCSEEKSKLLEKKSRSKKKILDAIKAKDSVISETTAAIAQINALVREKEADISSSKITLANNLDPNSLIIQSAKGESYTQTEIITKLIIEGAKSKAEAILIFEDGK